MSDDQAAELTGLSHALLDEVTLADRIEVLLAYTVHRLGGVRAGVVLVRREARVETGVTDPVLARLDAVQRQSGAGPDLDLLTDRDLLHVGDLTTYDRWPQWRHEAERSGLRSLIGVRLRARSVSLGAITCYAARPHHFGPADPETLRAIGRCAAPTLATAGERDRLWDAVDARRLIGMAQGVLMESYGVDGDQAADVLSRRCRERRLSLPELAGQLVGHMTLPT